MALSIITEADYRRYYDNALHYFFSEDTEDYLEFYNWFSRLTRQFKLDNQATLGLLSYGLNTVIIDVLSYQTYDSDHLNQNELFYFYSSLYTTSVEEMMDVLEELSDMYQEDRENFVDSFTEFFSSDETYRFVNRMLDQLDVEFVQQNEEGDCIENTLIVERFNEHYLVFRLIGGL